MPMNLATSKSAIPYTWPSCVRAKTNRSPCACRPETSIKKAPVAIAGKQQNRRMTTPPRQFMKWTSLRWLPHRRVYDVFDSDIVLGVEGKPSLDGIMLCRLDLPG